MRLLLDTHVLLWWLSDSALLSEGAQEAIAEGGNEVFVSAATIWETGIKAALGKLEGVDGFLAATAQFTELPITWQHAETAAGLPAYHQDPFDRMLVAQAYCESLTLVTRDTRLADYGVAVLKG